MLPAVNTLLLFPRQKSVLDYPDINVEQIAGGFILTKFLIKSLIKEDNWIRSQQPLHYTQNDKLLPTVKLD